MTPWPTVSPGETCGVVNGGTPNSKIAQYWGADVQWLTSKDMGKMAGKYIADTPYTILQAGLSKFSGRPVPPCSVICPLVRLLAIWRIWGKFSEANHG